ncbi:mitochondrial ribosomal protein subunit L2 [Dichomitus squalens]|uniref:Large ribosomal subunit protein uL2m n=1 Tax=Dichomitus squalens TaxID=114155 RepID=A0A4Q9Q5Y5_9APHY|nr:mitochondrial ribosomal protein subunit L2 [Dichomitus squalens]
MFSSARCLLRSAFSAINVASTSSFAAASSSSALASSSSAVLPHVLKNARRYATEATTSQQSPSEVNAALARTSILYKTYKPVTPGIRHLKRPLSPHLYQGRPLRELTVPLRKRGGRNHHGRITVRHRGGGHKQRIRIVDFMRTQPGPCDVVRIEYDPGRSAHIALIKNRNPNLFGEKVWSYILAPDNLRAGDVVESFRQGIPDGLVPGFVDSKDVRGKALEKKGDVGLTQSQTASTASLALGVLRAITIKPGNVVPLRLIPPGTIIHNIALNPQGRAVLVRSAGTFGQVVAHEDSGKYSQVRLQSGEVRKVLQDCVATVGKVSNPLWKNRNLGKAGRNRWLGRRPRVRGMAMNRCDHPHGGGRGKSKGNKQPRSVWGWVAKGVRTRKPGPKGPKNSNKMVIRERPRGKEKRGL